MSRDEMKKKMAEMAKGNPEMEKMIADADLEKMTDAEMQSLMEKMAKMQEGKSFDDTLIVLGGAIKSLGDGKYGGTLIRFTAKGDYDLTGDRFDAKTDYGFKRGEAKTVPLSAHLFFHHAQPLKTKSGKQMQIEDEIGTAELTMTDEGIEVIAQARKEYDALLARSLKSLGWSSGTANHLVKRVTEEKGQYIKRWLLGDDVSMTPTPAESRNAVYAMKSLPQIEMDDDELPTGGAEGTVSPATQTASHSTTITQQKIIGGIQMDEKEVKALVEAQTKPLIDANVAQAEEIKTLKTSLAAEKVEREKVTKALEAEKPAGSGVKMGHAEEDNKFKSLAEQCLAVKAFKLSGGENTDPRLKRLSETKAASGAQVGISSEGGFLVEPTLTAEVLKPIHELGQFSSRARSLPVGSNSNYGWINGIDETNRATGSRWGGIRGYRVAEATAPTASKPKFRRINWELKKYAVLVYGTDELLADASQFSEVVRVAAAEELSFMVNDDMLNGDGAAGCLGILSSGAPVQVTRTTASHVVYEDLIGMWARMDSRSKPNAVWFVNTDVNPDLDTLAHAVGAGALEPKFVGYDATGLMRIKGRPVIETEFNASLGTSGDIVLADMSNYLMWEKGGVQSAESLHVLFTTDETTFRFIYRVDGQPAIAAPLTPYKGTGNTISPFVKLS